MPILNTPTYSAVAIATALYVGVFNIGIAMGAWGGGRLLDSVGLPADRRAAAGLAMGATPVVATTTRRLHGARRVLAVLESG
ncbi:hypothetical protein DI494_22400, partial [Stenotrophomonas maltophilia]